MGIWFGQGGQDGQEGEGGQEGLGGQNGPGGQDGQDGWGGQDGRGGQDGQGGGGGITITSQNLLQKKFCSLCLRKNLFQDGSHHHGSDTCRSFRGNIGFTSEFGSVNKGSPKW